MGDDVTRARLEALRAERARLEALRAERDCAKAVAEAQIMASYLAAAASALEPRDRQHAPTLAQFAVHLRNEVERRLGGKG